ncbi:MAG: GntP family permease [Fusobacterium mortiferum]|jgi:GntP family gluconate:H+ symporter|uniref:GntP family permease n=1 Tax=Fusobacterium TaxID=848 RepID=UPI0012B37DEF|nr:MULTISPECIES: gluconate:H+ symporter [Fusobacterium]MCF2699252.1 TRAP transporter large permease subunit [Fusobacterium mortiferum]MCI7187142.1 GntP family permease [Fusobacterium mortiferum]MCI7665056.1 GntP family permease [Fusobacterium mortiferum]MSS61364.1 TRAP transporter large permease subunit [Fusobacterium sp. FSA-380-WT-2B]
MEVVSSTQMLFGLFLGIAILIFLSMKTKVHTFIALIIATMVTGLIGGMSVPVIMSGITKGFGNTLSSTGIIIGLGVMMGIILEKSGAAEQMAFTIIKIIGKNKEEWALGLTGYVVSIPVFSDSALVILTPIAKALSKLSGKSVVGLGLALATGLQLTHVFVPPTPGPLTVAGILGVDVGVMIMAGIVFTIPVYLVSMLYCKWLGKKIYQVPSDVEGEYIRMDFKQEYLKSIENIEEIYKSKKLPSAFLSFAPVVCPLILIFINTIIGFVGIKGTAASIAGFIGHPIVALIIGTLLSVYGLGKRMSRKEVNDAMSEAIESTGMIMLITGAGGSLGFIVRDSGIGNALGELVLNAGIPGLLIPFIIAALMRIALGSATVALTTAATLTAPLLTQLGINPVLAAMSTCAGGVAFSYFNDSGFWVFNGLYGLSDIKDQFWAKTMISFVGAGGALLMVLLASLFI